MAAAVRPETIAILVSPSRARACRRPAAPLLAALRELCDRRELLLILEEIQTAFGRTRHAFAYQHGRRVAPDIMTLAKALGGAYRSAGHVHDGSDRVGPHARLRRTTFGGNPLACAAAVAAVRTLADPTLPGARPHHGRAPEIPPRPPGREARAHLAVRSRDLMAGLLLTAPPPGSSRPAWSTACLVNGTADRRRSALTPR